jgi:23S rRNA-/tRNA-specific pseudouridylate synthase
MSELLYRDGSWLALDKPVGVVTTPPTTRGGRPLVDEARALAPTVKYHHPLSRLDADVSGVVLFALTHDAIERANTAAAQNAYHRRYVGLVSPAPAGSQGAWTWPVAVDRRDRTRRTTGPGDDPQTAETRFEVLARAGAVAFVVFTPVTGRTHQIRVHAKAAGAPLVGDVGYGGARRVTMDDGSVVSTARTMLHAWRVRVPGARRVIEAPLPADFAAVWAQCGGDPDVLALHVEA